jgi:predicted transcriptional regulator
MAAVATSLKLPKALKDRIDRFAKRAGETPHACMVRLLEQQLEAAERFDKFVAEARAADRRMQKTGLGHPASDVYEHLEARIAGRRRSRPKPVPWRE